MALEYQYQRLREYHRSCFKDRVFTASDWQLQKSWRRHLPDLTGARVLLGFLPVVLWTVLVALFVCCYHVWLESAGAPSFYQDGLGYWQAFSVTSFALSLLLVFRTNSSYGRWWEARIMWGQVLNVTRNLVREAVAQFGEADEAKLQLLVRWTMALPFLLKAHLSGSPFAEHLQGVLEAEELHWLLQGMHKPNRAVQVLSLTVMQANVPPIQRAALDEQLTTFVNTVGACERIQKTPIPLPYTRHTSRFLVLWLTFLPFALWPVYGWATPGIVGVISFLLLGVENIGIQMEEPFAVLAMDAVCASCQANVLDMMDTRAGATKVVAKASQAASLMSHNLANGVAAAAHMPVTCTAVPEAERSAMHGQHMV